MANETKNEMIYDIKIEKPRLFFEPYVGYGNKLQTKIGCAVKITLGGEKGTETYFAYGSTVYSRSDKKKKDKTKIGAGIAQQRAAKIVKMFESYGYDSTLTGQWLAYCKAHNHMELLTEPEFGNLEAKVLQPFREPEKVVDLTKYFDKADFGTDDIDKLCGINLQKSGYSNKTKKDIADSLAILLEKEFSA